MSVPDGKVFELIRYPAATPNTVPVVDERDAPSTDTRLVEGTIVLGDRSLSPQPAEALAQALSQWYADHASKVALPADPAAAPVRLQAFKVTASACNVASEPSRQPMPGMAAVDSGIRALAQSIGGCADVVVTMTVASGDRTFSGYGSGRYPAAVGAWSIDRPFGRAVESFAAGLASVR